MAVCIMLLTNNLYVFTEHKKIIQDLQTERTRISDELLCLKEKQQRLEYSLEGSSGGEQDRKDASFHELTTQRIEECESKIKELETTIRRQCFLLTIYYFQLVFM